MKLSLKQISRIGENEYEVLFEDEIGSGVIVNCAVEFDNSVPFITPKPDVFMDGKADARAVSAAVLAFHRAAIGKKP